MIGKLKSLRERLDEMSKILKLYTSLGYLPDAVIFNLDKTILSLLMAKAWMGKALGMLGNVNPYAKHDGNRKNVEDIDPAADTSDGPTVASDAVILTLDTFRQVISEIISEFEEIYRSMITKNYTKGQWGDLVDREIKMSRLLNVDTHLQEARIHLGFTLGAIKDHHDGKGQEVDNSEADTTEMEFDMGPFGKVVMFVHDNGDEDPTDTEGSLEGNFPGLYEWFSHNLTRVGEILEHIPGGLEVSRTEAADFESKVEPEEQLISFSMEPYGTITFKPSSYVSNGHHDAVEAFENICKVFIENYNFNELFGEETPDPEPEPEIDPKEVLSGFGKVETCKVINDEFVAIVITKGFNNTYRENIELLDACTELFPDYPIAQIFITDENLAILNLSKRRYDASE